MAEIDLSKSYPVLKGLMDRGLVWFENFAEPGGVIFAMACDGPVIIGNCDTLQAIGETEEYLRSHRDPSTW